MKKVNVVFGAALIASAILFSCGGEKPSEESAATIEEKKPSESSATTEAVTTVDVEQLAKDYCDWAQKEADAKDAKDKVAREEADTHTDALQKQARSLPEADKDRFRELTKDCKEHN